MFSLWGFPFPNFLFTILLLTYLLLRVAGTHVMSDEAETTNLLWGGTSLTTRTSFCAVLFSIATTKPDFSSTHFIYKAPNNNKGHLKIQSDSLKSNQIQFIHTEPISPQISGSWGRWLPFLVLVLILPFSLHSRLVHAQVWELNGREISSSRHLFLFNWLCMNELDFIHISKSSTGSAFWT